MRVIEITAVGFDGSSDKTDDRVLWIRADNAESVHDRLHMLNVPHIDVNEIEIKFAMPGEVIPLDHAIAKLFKFAMDDMRAALKPFAELLEEPANAETMELFIDPLDVVRAQEAMK